MSGNTATVTLKFVGEDKGAKATTDALGASLDTLGKKGEAAGQQTATGQSQAQAALGRTDSAVKQLIQNASRMGSVGQQAGNAIASGAKQGESALQSLFTVARDVRATLAVLAGIKLASNTAMAIAEEADAYTNLSSKLRTITDSQKSLNRVRESTFDIAQRTRSDYDATVTLYARLTRATENLALSEKQRLAITETITKAYTLNGATVQEATNSIIQLTQGLASGTLRGEEFNSVAEQGPIILEMLSRSLGKTRGELRQMAAQGKLTADVVTKALLENQKVIDDQFAKVSITIDGGLQRVANAWTKWIGESATASGVSRDLAGVLTSLASNMGTVADTALDLAGVIALIFSGRALGSLTEYMATQYKSVAATLAQAAAQRELAIAEAQSAEAALVQAQATRAAVTAALDQELINHQIVLSEREKQVAIVRTMEAVIAEQTAVMNAALAHVEAATSAGALSLALREAAIAEAQLTESTSVLATAEAKLEASNAAVIASNAALTTSRERLVGLTVAEAEATTALALAETRAAVTAQYLATTKATLGSVLGLVATGASRVLALIGGWPTLLLAAAYAAYQFMSASDDLAESLRKQGAAVDDLKARNAQLEAQAKVGNDTTRQQIEIQFQSINSTLEKARAEEEAIQKERDYYDALAQTGVGMGTAALAAAAYQIKLVLAQHRTDDAYEAQKRYNEELRKYARLALFRNVEGGSEVSGAADPKKIQALTKELTSQNIALEANKIHKEQSASAALAFSIAEKAGVDSVKQLPPAIQELIAKNGALLDAQDAAKASVKAKRAEDKLAAQDEHTLTKVIEEATRAHEKFTDVAEQLADVFRSPVAKANETYRKQMKLLNDEQESANTLFSNGSITLEEYTQRQEALAQAYDNANQQHGVMLDLAIQEQDVMGKLAQDTSYEQKLITMTQRQQVFATAYKKAVDYFNQNRTLFNAAGVSLDKYATAAAKAAQRTYDLGKAQEILKGDKSPIFQMVDQVEDLKKALEDVSDPMSEAFDPKKAEMFRKAIEATNDQLGVKMVGSYNALLGAVRSFTKEGSASYNNITKGMAALQIAQDLIAMRAAVIAVLTQAEGEPYSAFARMAAMAAAVAPFLADIGMTLSSISGGSGKPSAQSAEVRQRTQGTGSILGDATAQSNSIAEAVEITANATTQLVGLNRGMLDALQSLQHALGAAGNMLAHGAGDATFAGTHNTAYGLMGPLGQFNPLLNALTGGNDPIGNAIGSFLWGGKQKVIDQGILIAGGTLGEMINSIVVGAYQTIQTSGGLFGSGSTGDQLAPVSDAFSKQFQLVIGSIVDTVRAGATALGLLPADIEARLQAFKVEEIRISLKGLSAEDQQKAIEAVFSKIFDDLAGSVVPFIGQFQQVGEGLGETLVRVATEVQIVQEAFKQFGKSIDETDPEKFAQIADELVQAVGGIDAFISGMNKFVESFGSDANKFSADQKALQSAFEQTGLTLPATRQGMWDLMKSLDATTEEGRKQIAIILKLADVESEYYDMLENQVKDAANFLQELGVAGYGLSSFQTALQGIKENEAKAIEAANLLAVAHGREGASAIELAAIHQWTAKQIAAAMHRLQQETQDLIAQLYGGIPGSLDAINARISELEQSSSDAGGSIDDVSSALDDLFQRWKDGIKSLQDYLNDSLFGDLSPLTPEQQLTEAQSQLDALIAAARGGDAGALAQLPQAMQQFAQLLRGSQASGDDYNSVILEYRRQLEELLRMQNPGTPAGPGSEGNPIHVAVEASAELQALYAARDAEMADQERAHRAQLAQQLAQNLHDMAVLTRTPILDMIALQGVALDQLAADMGVDLQNLTAGSVQALGNMATTLGIPLGELVQALGLSLPDLRAGITELTTTLGIDLTNLTSSTVTKLAELALSLGTNLHDLSEALGIDLGKLTDVNSPLFVALKDNIATLSPDIKDELQPFLDGIKNATSEEDKNKAVKALRDHVDSMAPDIKTLLAPYFEDIIPPDALTQLDYLEDLQVIASDQLNVLKGIAKALDVPGYAVGSSYINKDHLAMVHQGEMIIDSPSAAVLRKYGVGSYKAANDDTGAVNQELVAEIKALRKQMDQLITANTTGSKAVATAVTTTAASAQVQRAALAAKTGTNKSERYGK